MEILLDRYGKYLIFALLPLAVLGGAGAYFVYEVKELSFLAGGTKYAPVYPTLPPVDAKTAHYCGAAYSSPWIACTGAIQ